MLTGKNLIAGELADSTGSRFTASGALAQFDEASSAHVDRALVASAQAAHDYRSLPSVARAAFLDRIADAIAHADGLIETAGAETALPPERLAGERARTVGQLRMFANVVREGSWVDARIDRAQPDRQPLPKPDVRRMLIQIGPCFLKISQSSGVMRCGRNTGMREPMRMNSTCLIASRRTSR